MELEENIPAMEDRLIARKILLIFVGSAASIHISKNIVEKQPSIAMENEFMIIETSKDMFNTAIKTISRSFYDAYRRTTRKDVAESKGFPYSTFMSRLKNNSVLLDGGGGGAVPEAGLRFYNTQRHAIVEKIEKIIIETDCYGVVVIGCSGKGTGSLVAPALINDLSGSTIVPTPIGIILLPFRFASTDINNAMMTIRYIIDNNVPTILVDYEHALQMFLYMRGEEPKSAMINQVYASAVDAITRVLSVLIETLNYGQFCLPPIDWSDLESILRMKGRVGTISYSFRRRKDDFDTNWKSDLNRMVLLRTKSKPDVTHTFTVIRSGTSIDIGTVEELSKYFRVGWHTTRHLSPVLTIGEGYTIANIIWGFDPSDIEPELKETKLGWLDRLRGM